jgi:hypothetical protein
MITEKGIFGELVLQIFAILYHQQHALGIIQAV